MQQNYPDHIYEPIRREIAVSYIRHELRKYLPSLRDRAVHGPAEFTKKILADIGL